MLKAVLQQGWRASWRSGNLLLTKNSNNKTTFLPKYGNLNNNINNTFKRYCSSSTSPLGTKTSAEERINALSNTLKEKPDAKLFIARALEYANNREFEKSCDDLSSAAGLDKSFAVQTTCASLACLFDNFALAIKLAEPMLEQQGDNKLENIKLYYICARAYYGLLMVNKVIEMTSKYIENVPEEQKQSPEVAACYAMRVVALYNEDKRDEARENFLKLEQLPVPKTSIIVFPKIMDAKWTFLGALYEANDYEGIKSRVFQLLFEDSDLKRPPIKMQREANRFLFWQRAVKKAGIPAEEAITRLNNEIINSPDAHPFWKSCAIMAVKDLSNLTAEERLAASYRAVTTHQNTFTVLGLCDLREDLLAANPEIDREQLLGALAKFSALLFYYRNDPYSGTFIDKKINFWTHLAAISFTLQDVKRTALFCEMGLKCSKEITEGEKYILHRIGATCSLLLKDFSKCLELALPPRNNDEMFALVQATAHVMMGEEHYLKAWDLIFPIFESFPIEKEYAVHYTTAQMTSLVLGRNHISEDLHLEELGRHWRSFCLSNSVPAQEQIEKYRQALSLPGLRDHFLLAILRCDIQRRLAYLYADARDVEQSIRLFTLVANECPLLAPHLKTPGLEAPSHFYYPNNCELFVKVLKTLIQHSKDPNQIEMFELEIAKMEVVGGDLNAAREHLLKCQDKTSEKWLTLMTDICWDLYLNEEALEHANKLVAKDESNKARLIVRGNILAQLNRIDEAKADYENAMIQADPKHTDLATMGLARLYEFKEQNYTKALELYAKIVGSYPEEAHIGSAHCLFAMNLAELALEQIELAFKHSTSKIKNPAAVLLRGKIYAQKKEYERALVDFQTIIDTSPDLHADAYFSRGTVHYFLNNPEKATADFEEAVKINPNAELLVTEFYKEVQK